MYWEHSQLGISLERPEFVMGVFLSPNKTNSFNYKISDMRYKVCFIQPSDEVLEMYRMSFNSESPEVFSINIPHVSYQNYKKYLQSTNGLHVYYKLFLHKCYFYDVCLLFHLFWKYFNCYELYP